MAQHPGDQGHAGIDSQAVLIPEPGISKKRKATEVTGANQNTVSRLLTEQTTVQGAIHIRMHDAERSRTLIGTGR